MKIIKSKTKILKWLIYLCILFGIINFIATFNPSLTSDEAFSMAMVHHGYSAMLHLSYFDVHPPLYYLVLKTFLIITTFWTKSILIKIMFAKTLSVTFFAITFYILYLILKEFNIKSNKYLQLIIYMITLPTIILMVQIRMYELATLLLAIELYELVKFIKYGKNYFLIISILSAVLASYTHYFAAMFAGSLLLVYALRMIPLHNWHKLYKFICGILAFILLFAPCLWFAIRQFTYVSSSKYTNIQGNTKIDKSIFIQMLGAISSINFHNIAEIILGIIITFTLIYLTIHYLSILNGKLYDLLINLILVFIISLIIPLIFSVINHPIIQGRYYYPIISIYEFILIGIILQYITLKTIPKFLFSVLSIILLCFSLGNLVKSTRQYITNDASSLCSYKRITSLPYNRHSILNINSNNLEQESVYAEYKATKYEPIFIIHNKQIVSYLGASNKKLLTNVFNNFNIRYK